MHAQNKYDWIDAAKAFALIGVLLNHFTEAFGPGPWFTNPSDNWPEFSVRLQNIFPSGESFLFNLITFFGWLGDSGPGVFILLSGLGLTLAQLRKSSFPINLKEFYTRRLLKLFPLYIAANLLILGASFVLNGTYHVSDPRFILSLSGFRFTDTAFFFLNPSWWFVWLIIQMYILFPFLYKLLNKAGVLKFLVYTFLFTFISRTAGLIGFQPGNLYYWMTGIFCGTRLAEFTTGMMLAVIIHNETSKEHQYPAPGKIIFPSLVMYISGLFASFTWYGSIVSNLLVTIGLCGVFYFTWHSLFSKVLLFLKAPVIKIGLISYAVYLIHQPLLIWTVNRMSPGLKVLAAISVICLSFPAAMFLDKLTTSISSMLKKSLNPHWSRLILFLIILLLAMLLLVVDDRIGITKKYAAYEYFLLLLALGLIFLYMVSSRSKFISLVTSISIITILLTLFAFPKQMGFAAFAAGIVLFIPGALIYKRVTPATTIIFSIVSSILIFAAAEIFLRNNSPIESGKWGEFDALQQHSTRTYSLIPNKVTHLKYNNYDYTLRTNSFGLASPEITRAKPANTYRILLIGDAFSMPEGVDYKSSYPRILEDNLNKMSGGIKYQVINAGVTGYGPAEQAPQLKELAAIFKPDQVLYQFFINEFHEASISASVRLDNIGFFSGSMTLNEIIFQESQVVARLKKIKTELFEYVDDKPIGWRYYKSLLHFYEKDNNSFYDKAHLDHLASYIAMMKKYTAEINAEFKIVFVPGAITISKPAFINYYPLNLQAEMDTQFDYSLPLINLLSITDTMNIQVYDLTQALREYPHQPVYYSDSWHWNKAGHKAAANEITRQLTGISSHQQLAVSKVKN